MIEDQKDRHRWTIKASCVEFSRNLITTQLKEVDNTKKMSEKKLTEEEMEYFKKKSKEAEPVPQIEMVVGAQNGSIYIYDPTLMEEGRIWRFNQKKQ